LVEQYMDGTVTTEPQNNGQACPEDLHPTRTITVDHTPGGPAAPTLAATATGNALTGLRIRAFSGGTPPIPAAQGSFRIVCAYSHMLFDDHIVFPAQPGVSHAHTFYGNTTTNGNSTDMTLAASTSSTCAGGIANLSSYWVPSLIDIQTNTAIASVGSLWYYKGNYADDPTLAAVIPPPTGLRMIAGKSPTATTTDPEWIYDRKVRFFCGADGTPTETIPVGCGDIGQTLAFTLLFPECWDGVNLDSPNHRSHMAFSNGYTCPASHPVMIPTLGLNIYYPVAAESGVSRYKLSSDTTGTPGLTAHADVHLMWDEDVAGTFTTFCVKARMDCHSGLLGDGTEVY
jgi:hypothetical protein